MKTHLSMLQSQEAMAAESCGSTLDTSNLRGSRMLANHAHLPDHLDDEAISDCQQLLRL